MDRAGERFASWQEGIAVRREAGLTLFFAPATEHADTPAPGRPDVAAIEAVAAGSGETVSFAISHEPQDHPYGERQYNAEDFYGHRWDFTETITDVAPEDWSGGQFHVEHP